MQKVPVLLRAGLWIGLSGVAPYAAHAQAAPPDAPTPHIEPHIQPRQLSGYFPSKPSIAPKWTIPIESLGFAAPAAFYLGERNSLTSLDFIGEDRLLLTFHVPALLRRTPGSTGTEREIRAVVLALPSGKVEAESNWLLHDRARYLWMLKDGHFLLRDRESLVEGDASLKLTPLLKFPGPLLSLQLDPGQQFLVTNSREPAQPAGKSGAAAESGSAAASSNIDTAETSGANEPDLVLRVLHRNSGDVMLVQRVRDLVRLPINDEGYLDSLRGNGVDWQVEMNFFSGGNRMLGTVKSACMPELTFISESELLADACADMGVNALVAMNTDGQKLWIDLVPDRQIWPLFIPAGDGQRIATETLYVSHSVDAFSPLGNDDIKGQWLQVFDAATGRLAFEAPVTPILDAGGNAALSPSGRRVALLNGASIEVFELPAPPPVPDKEHFVH